MAEAQKRAKGGKKNRKHGRNAHWCKAYEARRQREHNKIDRLVRHLIRYPNDGSASAALTRWKSVIRRRAAA